MENVFFVLRFIFLKIKTKFAKFLIIFSSDHLMSSLGFPSYSTVTSASSVTVASRKFHEGNGSGMSYLGSTPSEVSSAGDKMSPNVSSTPYPYFTSPGADLYSSTSPYSTNSSATGVFSSRTLQPTRPRSKSRANAGKISILFFS